MDQKRKISLTIDEDVYAAIEKVAESRDMTISKIVQQALKFWLRSETEKQMAQGYEDMADDEFAFAEMTLDAQKEMIS